MNLGVDVGGSYIKYFCKGEKGKIPTPRTPEELLASLRELAFKFRAKKIALAVAGLVEAETGCVSNSHNLPFLSGRCIKAELESGTGSQVQLVNAATSAAFGEYMEGAGRGAKVLVCLTVGTGLGAGAVVKGKPLTGAKGCAMEVGHTTVELNGWLCHCGRKGCLEAYASSYGLERFYHMMTGRCLPSEEIIERAGGGEEEAKRALSAVAEYLAVGVTNIVHVFNPDAVILGGGLVSHYPEMVKEVEYKFRKRAFKLMAEGLKVKPSALGEFSGAVGAYLLAEAGSETSG